MAVLPAIGILQGRLTPSRDGKLQFFPVDTWEDEFGRAREIGFTCIEVLVQFDTCSKHTLWTEEGTARLQAIAAEHALSLPSVHGFFKWKNHAGETTSALEKLIPAVGAIGAKTILISLFDENAIRNKEDQETVIRLLRPLADQAQALGIRLGLESEIPAKEFCSFVEKFQHPAMGIYYDIGNMVSMGVDVPAEIHLLKDFIVGVHVKDRRRGGETVPLGTGDADFPAIFSALKEIGYHGAYIIQGARDPNRDDISLNRDYYQFVRSLLMSV